jgi:hypothetical protein
MAKAAAAHSGNPCDEGETDARSVIDLIDSIERDSFRRNVGSRPPHRRYAPRPARSARS